MTLTRPLIASLVTLLGVVSSLRLMRSDVHTHDPSASAAPEEQVISLRDLSEAWLSEGELKDPLLWVNGTPINRAQLRALRVNSRPEHPSWLLLKELIKLVTLQQELLDQDEGSPLSATPQDFTQAQRWLHTLNTALDRALERSSQDVESQTSAQAHQARRSTGTTSSSQSFFVLSVPYQTQGSEGERAIIKLKLEELRQHIAQRSLTMTQALARHSPRSTLLRGLVNTAQSEPPALSTPLREALDSLELGAISAPLFDDQGGYLIQLLSRTRATSPVERAEFEQRSVRAEQRRIDREVTRSALVRRLMRSAQLKLSPTAKLNTPPPHRSTRLKLISSPADVHATQP